MNKYLRRRRWFRRSGIERLEDKRPLSSDFSLSLGTPISSAATGEPAAAANDITAKFRLEITDQQGVAVSEVEVGERFQLNVFVQDRRGEAAVGVFSPYLDIVYEQMLAAVAGEVSFGDTYPNSNSADTSTPGLVNEAGGFGFFDEFAEKFSVGAAGGEEYFLLSVPFVANAPGELSFVGDAADLRPYHDLYFFDTTTRVPAIDVDYGSTSVTIVSPPTMIIDNGSSGFVTQGGWVDYAGIGYEHDLVFNAAGTGADQARWSFPVTPGRYRVSATWTAHRNRATNAPYQMQVGDVLLEEVRVNQEVAPKDFVVSGTSWAILGTYDIVGDNLSVMLSDDANEFVIADAVLVERLGDAELSPAIQLILENRVLRAGEGIDFGAVVAADPVFKTFTVKNSGTDALQLVPLNTQVMPNGFRLLADYATTTLQPGESTTFSIQLLTNAPLSTNDVLEIKSNVESGPFELMLRGNVRPAPVQTASPTRAIQIIDDGDANHLLQNQWTRYSGIGTYGDVHFAAAGNGASTSRWTFQVEPGYYRVAVTWAAHPNRASNAPYQVRTNSNHLGEVRVDQQVAPHDFTASGASWRTLGTYQVTGHAVIVQLSNDANGFVIADAVRIERVSAPVVVPTNLTQIIDNGQNGFAVSGSWRDFTGAGRDQDVLFSDRGSGDDVARWSFNVSPGEYRVSTTWAAHPNRASDAPYEVRAGNSLLGSKRVNQQVVPSSFQAEGSAWLDLGTFSVAGDTLVVQLSDLANGFVIADAVRIERVG